MAEKGIKHKNEEKNPREMGGSTLDTKKVKTTIQPGHLAAAAECQKQEPTVLHPCIEVKIDITCVCDSGSH